MQRLVDEEHRGVFGEVRYVGRADERKLLSADAPEKLRRDGHAFARAVTASPQDIDR